MSRTAKRLLGVALIGSGLAWHPAWAGGGGSFSIDVAGDCTRFAFQNPDGGDAGDTPTENAVPAFGATFVQEGVIYPGGTFDRLCPGDADCGLMPADDSTPEAPAFEPEFAHLVIGKWTCRGTFVADGGATESGVWIVSTQLYDFDPDEPGRRTLVSEGSELVDLGVPFDRAVTGGSGAFAAAGGRVTQTKVGFNRSQCENYTFDFAVRPAASP